VNRDQNRGDSSRPRSAGPDADSGARELGGPLSKSPLARLEANRQSSRPEPVRARDALRPESDPVELCVAPTVITVGRDTGAADVAQSAAGEHLLDPVGASGSERKWAISDVVVRVISSSN